MAIARIGDVKTHPERDVRVSDLARDWNVPPRKWYRDIDKGALPVERIGPTKRIRVAIVEARRDGAPNR